MPDLTAAQHLAKARECLMSAEDDISPRGSIFSRDTDKITAWAALGSLHMAMATYLRTEEGR